MVRGAPRQIFEKQRLSGERSLPNSNCQGMSWSDPVRTHRGCGSEGKSCPKLELARGVDVYLDGAVWLVPGRRQVLRGWHSILCPVRHIVRGNVEAKVFAFSYRERLVKREIQVPRPARANVGQIGRGVTGNERIRRATVLRAGYCEAVVVDPVRRRTLKALRRIADQIGSLIEVARSYSRRR